MLKSTTFHLERFKYIGYNNHHRTKNKFKGLSPVE
ncbi:MULTISPECIES: IS3 family transposase [Photorhabdus]